MSRHIWLLIALCLWAAAAVYAWAVWPSDERRPLTHVKGKATVSQPIRQTGTSASSSTANAPGLTVRKTPRPQPPAAVARDLFVSVEAFRPKPPPPPPPPPAPPPPPPPPPPTSEELAAARARQELSQFRYIGYLNKGGGKDQAFLSRNGELMTVQRGETLQGRFFVKDVTPARVVIVESATKIEASLSLSSGQ